MRSVLVQTLRLTCKHCLLLFVKHNIQAPRAVVYCRSLNMCADLYAHFHSEPLLVPIEAAHVCENRLIAMYHTNTPQHNKEVVLKSMTQPDCMNCICHGCIGDGEILRISSLRIVLVTLATSSESDLAECACVPTGTSDSLSNCLQIACNVLTKRAALCRDLSVKFAPMDAMMCFSSLLTCSL